MSNNINKYEQLFEFCERGKTSKCIELIKSGLNLNDIYDGNAQVIDVAITKVLLACYHQSNTTFKLARLRRCLDYLLSMKVDYSKCFVSFFTAACITDNYKIADKLLANGFDVNQRYKNHKSYYDHVLEVSVEMYGRYEKKKKRIKINKTRMRRINYLLQLESADFSKCKNSGALMTNYNHIESLDLLKKKGLVL